jgi:hypothetical protein
VRGYRRPHELGTEPWGEATRRAWYYLRAGEKQKLRELLELEGNLPEFGQNPTEVAPICAELRDLDQCFRWLDKAFQSHDLPLMNLRLDPSQENVCPGPRHAELLRGMKLD